MDLLQPMALGLSVAFRPLNLLLALSGVLVGTTVGMLPGIGPINAIALLLPVVFVADLPPESALILLTGIYYGSQYGNSISTILLNVPGTASSVVTALDGHAMTRKGQAGQALALSAIASFAGGTLSIVGFITLGPLLSAMAIRFGPAEYFALMVFAFAALSGLTAGGAARALAATGLGLLLASVGMDPNSAVPRFTFGSLRLFDGLDFVVVTIGLFAVSEVLLALLDPAHESGEEAGGWEGTGAAARGWFRWRWTMLRSSVVGFLTGVLPGAGGTMASFLAYGMESRAAGADGQFGEGDPRGVVAPEAANNAAATGAMIPLLTLGVPGSGTTAVLLGALLGLNVTPGPFLIERQPEVFWGLAASMVVGNVFLLVLNLPLVGLFVRVLTLPRWILMPAVAALSFVAVYAVNRSVMDLLLMTGFGVLGLVLRRGGIPLAPVVLGLVLGPLMERSLRRALALSGGSWDVMFSSPIAITLWLASGLLLLAPIARMRRTASGPHS